MKSDEITNQKLDILIDLIRMLLAVELAKMGVSQILISKRLKLRNAVVGRMLKGIKRNK